ncbi:MAG: hypothetical protein ABI472_07120 [Ginsengibacter sp.]
MNLKQNTMMRFVLFALTASLLITSCNQKESVSSASNAINDLASENLKGDVTQVETDSYVIDSTGKTGPLDEKRIEKYDSSGYAVSYVSMNGKDSIKSQSKYMHNANGFMTSMQTDGANNEKKSSMTIEYDSAGNYSQAKSYDSTGKIDVYYKDITANKFGQVTGATGYHPDSTLKMSFSNDYDSVYYVGGNAKDSVGKLTYSGKVTLNDKKDLATLDETIITTDPKTKKDSTKSTITTYTYDGWDNHGNWTQQTSFNEKGKPIKMVKRIIVYKQ